MNYTIENGMKTFDGAELVMRNYTKEIAKYPANSLSKREIITTISTDGADETKFDAINSKLTKLVYDEAKAAVDKNKGTFKVTPSEWLAQLTAKAKEVAEQ